jgi:hypothetical protein
VSRRGSKRRQTERKARNRERTAKLAEHDPSYDEPLTEERRRRTLLRFSNLVSRGLTLSFVSMGLTVRASNPEELRSETTKVLAELTKGRTPS